MYALIFEPAFMKKAKKVDILLISPLLRQFFPPETLLDDFNKKFDIPYGLLSIASYLKSQGYSVAIEAFDYRAHKMGFVRGNDLRKLETKIISDIMSEYDTKVVGIGCYTIQYPGTLRVLKQLKRIKPQIKTVLGGPHVTFLDREALAEADNLVDFVVRGEGEYTVKDLLDFILKRAGHKKLEDIKGLSYRDATTGYIKNPDQAFVDLATLPGLNYDFLAKEYIQNANLHIIRSRGCRQNCKFCVSPGMYRRTIRYRPTEQIRKEINFLVTEYGIAELGIFDEVINADKVNFEKLCAVMGNAHRVHGVNFWVQTRADMVGDATLKLMKESGVITIAFGAESGSDKVLAEVSKHLTYKKIHDAVARASEHGLKVFTFWIFGLPSATKADEEKTLKGIREILKYNLIRPELAIFVPYPGTYFHKNMESSRIVITNPNYEEWGRLNSAMVFKHPYMTNEEVLRFYQEGQRVVSEATYGI